jgi:cation transport ATPase
MQTEATLSITGMTCGSCVQSVETLAMKVEGVESAAVNLPMMRGRITLAEDAGQEVIQMVIAAIERGGFGASQSVSPADRMEEDRRTLKRDQRKVIVALLLALPTVWLTMFAKDMGSEYNLDIRHVLGVLRLFTSVPLVRLGHSQKRICLATNRPSKHGCAHYLGDHGGVCMVCFGRPRPVHRRSAPNFDSSRACVL